MGSGGSGYIYGGDAHGRVVTPHKLKRDCLSWHKSTGTGLIGLGIVLIVVGAIMKFAVSVTTTGFNINTADVILLVVGIICCVLGLIAFGVASTGKSVTRESVRVMPDGGHEKLVQQSDRTAPSPIHV